MPLCFVAPQESTNLVDGDDRSCEVLQAGKYHEADGLANNRRPGSVGKYGKVGAAIGVVGLTLGLSVGLTGNSSRSNIFIQKVHSRGILSLH